MTNFTFAAQISSFKGGIDPIDIADIDINLTRNTTMKELEELERQLPTYDDVIDMLDRAPRDWSPSGWIVTIDDTRLDCEFDESITLSNLFEAILETKWFDDAEMFKSLRAAVYPLAYDWKRHTPAHVAEDEAKEKFQDEFESMMYEYQKTIMTELAEKHKVDVDWIYTDHTYHYK